MIKQKSLETLNFEEALGELEVIVRSLEMGEAALEDSISAYERGIKLKIHCEKKLHDAQTKIEKISIDKNGALTTQPLDSKG